MQNECGVRTQPWGAPVFRIRTYFMEPLSAIIKSKDYNKLVKTVYRFIRVHILSLSVNKLDPGS